MSLKRRYSGPVPERWLHCPPHGNHLIVAKFMPLKTPLSEDFDYEIPPQLRYPPQEVFSIAHKNKVKISLWIDLTNTNRYYYKEDVEQEGCEYVKLKCKGHDQSPTVEKTKQFIDIVHDHIMRNPFDSIAVHCTHGFNRTGFLITSFLVERLKFNVKVALETFAKSRPPGIYKAHYIKELYLRYGNIDDVIPEPVLPKWFEIDYEIEESSRKRKRDS